MVDAAIEMAMVVSEDYVVLMVIDSASRTDPEETKYLFCKIKNRKLIKHFFDDLKRRNLTVRMKQIIKFDGLYRIAYFHNIITSTLIISFLARSLYLIFTKIFHLIFLLFSLCCVYIMSLCT